MSITNQGETLRLNKYLSMYTGCSRRRADDLIRQGKAVLNGSKVTSPGVIVDGKTDRVFLNGRPVKASGFRPVYYMFYKPEKVLTARTDRSGRTLVSDYFKKVRQNIFHVGRLDWDSEGLLLLTNDGEFAQKALHPKYKIAKTYFVKIRGRLKPNQIQKLLKGVSLPGRGRKGRALYVSQKIRSGASAGWVKVIIGEGQNRQIRRMFQKIGCSVLQLRRVSIGRLSLGGLKKGERRRLSEKEVGKVFARPKELEK